jgi:hypothetical protein
MVGDAEGIQLFANRERLATQHEALAQETVQKLTQRGISSNGFTRFSMDAPGYGNHLNMAMRRDPAVLYGTEQIGGVAEDMSVRGLHDSHVNRLAERINETDEAIGEELGKAEPNRLTR